MKPLSERIKDWPSAKFVDWLCLACVDVREMRTEEGAQEEINKIRQAVTERLKQLEDTLRIKQNHIRLRDAYIEELEERLDEDEPESIKLGPKMRIDGHGVHFYAYPCEVVEDAILTAGYRFEVE
ncbi:hypothetical protein [Pantoea vagans]|uniref:hypothetical protein n=1 Tax=Pantoea vagans TaxID=470934 RepID=UPI00076B2894|nr:hypothetical protein [Pantoea vagans]AMG57712.1 hypothetical protein AL522_08730 [Pantoea vagans]